MEIELKKIVDNLRTATLLPRQCTDQRDVNEKKGQKVKSKRHRKPIVLVRTFTIDKRSTPYNCSTKFILLGEF